MRPLRLFGVPILSFLFLLLVAGCGRSGSLETRTFDLQHLSPLAAAQMVEPYVFTDRADSPGTIHVSEEGKLLTVREMPDNLARIERILAERDRPAPGVSLHFQVIEAGAATATPDSGIAEVEAALREVFRFEHYRLAGEAVVRTADGSEYYQRMHGDFTGSISGRLVAGRPDGGDAAAGRLTVRLVDGDLDMVLNTTVNLQNGRTIVVGTAGTGVSSEAIILVVRATFER